jgi:hypothetical protein
MTNFREYFLSIIIKDSKQHKIPIKIFNTFFFLALTLSNFMLLPLSVQACLFSISA